MFLRSARPPWRIVDAGHDRLPISWVPSNSWSISFMLRADFHVRKIGNGKITWKEVSILTMKILPIGVDLDSEKRQEKGNEWWLCWLLTYIVVWYQTTMQLKKAWLTSASGCSFKPHVYPIPFLCNPTITNVGRCSFVTQKASVLDQKTQTPRTQPFHSKLNDSLLVFSRDDLGTSPPFCPHTQTLSAKVEIPLGKKTEGGLMEYDCPMLRCFHLDFVATHKTLHPHKCRTPKQHLG